MKTNSFRINSKPATAEQHARAIAGIMERVERLNTCPFPMLKIPPLVEASEGDWYMERLASPQFSPGYFSAVTTNPFHDGGFWMLCERTDDKKVVTVPGKKEPIEANRARIWMSIAAMELESQAQMVQEAHGHVMVGGLGMGVAAWNLLLKPEVKSVHVFEKDPRIISLMSRSLAKWSRELGMARMKDFFVDQRDLLRVDRNMHWRKWDYALIDIWPCVGDQNLRTDIQSIAARYPAQVYGAWGIELDFVSYCIEQGIPCEVAEETPALWREYSRFLGFDIVGMHEPRMVKLAFQATTIQALGSDYAHAMALHAALQNASQKEAQS